jgi:hypothetical protein
VALQLPLLFSAEQTIPPRRPGIGGPSFSLVSVVSVVSVVVSLVSAVVSVSEVVVSEVVEVAA